MVLIFVLFLILRVVFTWASNIINGNTEYQKIKKEFRKYDGWKRNPIN